ncbi:rab-protein geranylgeranyltransferase [Pluteus cervinus]|uniref:Rab-protein geranylgeranyltransferase n=1 Tax=Pluteus cervinus TaxID=181527 RepID=A0ACD3ASN1_9AGAR|nr:rab-protein geranylgeranyltransferase [Pluteus cervinus]
MHGVKRVRHTREALEAKKLREQAKLTDYLALTDDLLHRKQENDYSLDAFKLTTRLLQVNPEFYTIWNYRRQILIKGIFPEKQPREIYEYINEELGNTMAALKSHPKVYWIWNHRRWCLENIPNNPDADGLEAVNKWKSATWDREMMVVEKLLNADARNFHAWSYRRYILANTTNPRPEVTEIAYTTSKIEANFSNFSAWHHRSKVYSSLWTSGKLDEAKCKEDEFDLVQNAMYTDPNDQSVWIYHRWLVGTDSSAELLNREVRAIEELLDQESNNKWCIESLVHYKRMLLSKVDGDERERLSAECKQLLERLQTLDPCRRERYASMIKQL